jgi:hypothetical protein
MHLNIMCCVWLISMVFIPVFVHQNPAEAMGSVQKDSSTDSNPVTFQERREVYVKQVKRLKKEFDAQIRAASTDEERRALQAEFQKQKSEYGRKFEESVRELQEGKK